MVKTILIWGKVISFKLNCLKKTKKGKMQTIGIIGGLGPEATQLLFKKIVDKTPAEYDQEHLPLMIFNNPQIPDRTKAILYNGKSPVPELIRSARILEISGADFIVIPCNTAHCFIKEIENKVSIPFINMIEATAQDIKRKYPLVKKIGLLATSGTVSSKIYHQKFSKIDMEIITPSEDEQENIVMESVYGKKGIKAGVHDYPGKQLERAGRSLINRGAELIITGCTEIPIVVKQENVDYPIVDPLTILAEKSVQTALIPKTSIDYAHYRLENLPEKEVLEILEEEE